MAAPAEITCEENESKGRHVLRLEGKPEAEMTFSKASEALIIIDHTEVPDALRGTGAGLAPVERAVEEARSAGKKILPLCLFASAQLKRHPEWANVQSR